jgi:dolichyl-diphosphooligosaccharide--protein glycosyltransferase
MKTELKGKPTKEEQVVKAEPKQKPKEEVVAPVEEEQVEDMFTTLRAISPIIKITILAIICFLAFATRVFSVIRYESVIHEFDPWFNFRTTKFLAKEGWYAFWNWYDSESWYPLGRVIGGTIFPGIMGTAASAKWLLDAIAMPMDIRNVCVFLAPVFSGFTAITTFFFTKECTNQAGAGLFAALFIAVIPSYISRSVAGSYDN